MKIVSVEEESGGVFVNQFGVLCDVSGKRIRLIVVEEIDQGLW